MKNYHRFVFLFICLSNILFGSFSLAQSQEDDKLGKYSISNHFVFAAEEYKKYGMGYRFMAKNNKVKAYYTDGTFEYLPRNVEVRVASIERGKFDHKSGLWIEFFSESDHKLSHRRDDTYYVFLGDLVDIEAVSKAANAADEKGREELRSKRRWEQIKKVSPYLFTILGVIFFVSGISSKCPKCGSWWKRKLLRKSYLGSRSYQTTQTESRPVYDNRGIEVGRVNVDVPVTNIRSDYSYNYCCKKCSHTWSKSVTR